MQHMIVSQELDDDITDDDEGYRHMVFEKVNVYVTSYYE